MELFLHQFYAREQAVAAFSEGAFEKSLCDEEFHVLSRFILCFATVGDASRDAVVFSPTRIEWRPRRRDYEPDGDCPWFPEIAREVYDRGHATAEKLREHHLFIRRQPDKRYLYAGPAHLACYGSCASPGGIAVSAEFWLQQQLPRDIWVRFGGYSGWRVDVNHEVHNVAIGDATAFDFLLNSLVTTEFPHFWMTRYEQDSLTIHLNPRRGWLMYLRSPEDTGVYARDPSLSEAAIVNERFLCACGIDLEFPSDQTLPVGATLEMAREYFKTGIIPAAICHELDAQ